VSTVIQTGTEGRTGREKVLLACDLGGTRLKIGLVRAGTVLARTLEPARSRQGLASHLPVLRSAWLRLLGQAGLNLENCAAISVAFPSLIDAATGRVLAEYGKYADAMDLDLRAWGRRELGLPLVIENDARMALIGEWQAGAGRDCNNVVMMTLGTGLGTAALIEGRVLRGRHGQAGVLGGHITVRHGGRPCTCGNLGCAEAEASTAALAALAASRPDFAASVLAREAVLDFAGVFRHAAGGDACAAALRDHSLQVWSSLAVNLIHAYDPEVVILGGGIMASAETVLPAVRRHVDRHAHTPWGKVRVLASQLGDDAALVAGEWLMREKATADAESAFQEQP
jgi:glucokinase